MIKKKEFIEKIKFFWEEQALKFKKDSLATTPDTIAFELELKELCRRIIPGSKVLDLGCGNGVKGVELVKKIECDYLGIDYSKEMIKYALENKKKDSSFLKGNIRFAEGNILDANFTKEMDFDFIISMRCLINLGSVENQIRAIKNLWRYLKKNGTYLMFENSINALNNINKVRETFNLSKIEVRWHNIYIDENNFFSKINDYFELIEIINYQSTYFLLSRTLNALLVNNENIDYLSKLNRYASSLPVFGDFAPQKLFILKKKI